MTQQLHVIDSKHIAFEMEAQVLDLRDLGYAVYASAHAISLKDPLRMVFEKLGLLIFEQAHELEEQRRRAAGQRAD
jgi:hypothetical protein